MVLLTRTLIVMLVAAAWAAPSLGTEPPQHGDHSGHDHGTVRPLDHAPIGVMGDHLHRQGDVMLSYRFMRMSMNGSRDGSARESASAVLRGFPVTPTDMDMEMHMLGAMWAPTHRVTLMGMVPLVRLDMKHKTRTGRRFTTRTQGLGDIRLTALVRLLERGNHRLHLNAGLSLPTGTISAKDDTPAGRVRLPYPMQLGSGTWDLLPGLTYNGGHGRWGWGSQLRGTIRTARNRKGYRLGHGWGASAWLARELVPWLSVSSRLDYHELANVSGVDDDLNARLVPTADPDRRAGRRLDLLFGLNLAVPSGPLAGHRLALELGRPIVQHLDGPQLETDWVAQLGWQLAF